MNFFRDLCETGHVGIMPTSRRYTVSVSYTSIALRWGSSFAKCISSVKSRGNMYSLIQTLMPWTAFPTHLNNGSTKPAFLNLKSEVYMKIGIYILLADIWCDRRGLIGLNNIKSIQTFNNFLTLSRWFRTGACMILFKPSSRKAEQLHLQWYSRSFVPWIRFQNLWLKSHRRQSRFSSLLAY